MTRIRLITALTALALGGSVWAQQAPAPAAAPARPGPDARLVDGVPPLPPGCLRHLPRQPATLPDFAADSRWQRTLGISADQARQVQQALATHDSERRRADAATCTAIRHIVGDKAMQAWAAATPIPSPPPPPPMPPGAPVPPAPPQPLQ